MNFAPVSGLPCQRGSMFTVDGADRPAVLLDDIEVAATDID
ncbi:hypothetical protein ABZU76_25325 [Amycolatopsis sp. NPDC005232]